MLLKIKLKDSFVPLSKKFTITDEKNFDVFKLLQLQPVSMAAVLVLLNDLGIVDLESALSKIRKNMENKET